jgi:hypothetical protein
MCFSTVMLVWSILTLLGQIELELSARISLRYTRTKHYFITNFDLGHTYSVFDVLFNCDAGLEHIHPIESIRVWIERENPSTLYPNKTLFYDKFDLGHTNSVFDVLFNCDVGLEHTHLIG